MASNSKIEWTDHTFNPWIGCTKISPACDHCYAERMAARMHVKWGPEAERRPASDTYWEQPGKWNAQAIRQGTRKRVFCASMADVFEGRKDLKQHLDRLFPVIERTTALDWLLLTKRPNNVMRVVPWGQDFARNVWIGCTAENQEWFDRRVPHLVQIPAAVRFLSCEPLRSPIDLGHYAGMIDWIILGGESGSSARPAELDWFRRLRDQAREANIPVFFKQWGNFSANGSPIKLRKKNDDRTLDGVDWSMFPAPKDRTAAGTTPTAWQHIMGMEP